MTLSNEELSIYVEGIQKQIDELNKVIKNGNESNQNSNSSNVNSEGKKTFFYKHIIYEIVLFK